MRGQVTRLLKGTALRFDLVLVAAVVIGINFLPQGDPIGVKALGLVQGASLALTALGMILILRSDRIINFAHAQIGLVSGVMFIELLTHNQFALFARTVCPPCFSSIKGDDGFFQAHPLDWAVALSDHHYQLAIQVNFVISAVLCVILAPLVSYIAYLLVIRLMAKAPRLLVTVATLGIGQIIAGALGSMLPLFDGTEDAKNQPSLIAGNRSIPLYPFHDLTVTVGGIPIRTGDVLMVVALGLAAVGLAALFRFSRIGVAIRAAADNSERAQTLGVGVASLSGIIWIAAGALAGVGSMLATLSGTTSVTAVSPALLVRVLAIIVLARLTNLTITVLAALALGIVDQGLQWNFGNPNLFELGLLILITLALLMQRNVASRGEQEATASYLGAREMSPIPEQLRGLPVVRSYRAWGIALLALVFGGLPFLVPPSTVSLAGALVIYAIVALSLLILTGWSGQISLGQFGFAAIGGYVAAILRGVGLDITLCVLGGAFAGAGVATLVGLPALRLKGVYLAIVTLAFALVTTDIVLDERYLGRFLPKTLDRPLLLGVNLEDEKVFYFFSLAILLICAYSVRGVRRSRTGRALIACRDNEPAARSYGVRLVRLRLSAFAMSGFLASLAGGLFAFHEHGVKAISYPPDQSITIFTTAVTGGLGSVVGPLVGATFYGFLQIFGGSGLGFLGSGAALVLILILLPGGLSAGLYKVRDAMLRRIAIRYRVDVPSLFGTRSGGGLTALGRLVPRRRSGGAEIFVPVRYRLANRWREFKEPNRG